MKRKYLSLLLIMFCALSCKEKELEVHSQQVVTLKNNSLRIITVGGKATEIAFDLGLGEQVVARDYHSLYPEEVNSLPALGRAHTMNVEAFLTYKPTHLVIWDWDSAGYQKLIDKAAKAGVKVIQLSSAHGVEPLRDSIAKVGEEFQKQVEAKELIAKVDKDLSIAAEYVKSKPKPGKGIFIFAKGLGTLELAGKGSEAELLMQLAGVETAIEGFEDYKPVNAEVIIDANPKNLLMVHKGIDSIGGIENLSKIQGVSQTDAFKNNNVFAIDRAAFEFGPRIGEFALELAKKINKDIPSLQR